MNEDIKLLLKAKNDEEVLKEVLERYKFFIISCARKNTSKFIDFSSDEYSIAQIAFVKALDKFDFEREKDFQAFASRVIVNALIDEYRKNKKTLENEVNISPFSFEDNLDEESNKIDFQVVNIVSERATNSDNENRILEIKALGESLEKFGFDFFEIAKDSPKAKKTKKYCKIAINYLLENPSYIRKMEKSGTLPIKILEKNLNLPRKILERHRRYIIAGVEIISGDYPYLSEYLHYIKERE